MTKTHQIILLFSSFALLTLTAALAGAMASGWAH
jgi:hypothetical protein